MEEDLARDIAEVPAVEVINTTAVHLMSAAAVQCGLSDDTPGDLAEARKLITALAGLVSAAAGEIGDHHARPLRDGLRSLQLAFREASFIKMLLVKVQGKNTRAQFRNLNHRNYFQLK